MAIEGFSAREVAAMTAAPRRYGFHATLKAPFALADGAHVPDLHRTLADFARRWRPLEIGEPRLRRFAGSLALLPETTPAVRDFAQACVEYFDFLRAPLAQADIDRRREARLTRRHEELLLRWGYPYVMETFRFHFTLTDRLADAPRRLVGEYLRPRVEVLAPQRLCIDALCLFEQGTPDAPFQLTRRYGFDGTLARFDEASTRRTHSAPTAQGRRRAARYR